MIGETSPSQRDAAEGIGAPFVVNLFVSDASITDRQGRHNLGGFLPLGFDQQMGEVLIEELIKQGFDLSRFINPS